MGIEGEEFRRIRPEWHDIMGSIKTGELLPKQITETAIQKFCGGCDYNGSNGVCKVVGSNNQARYAARNWCGWAGVNGVKGIMTDEGFSGGKDSTQPQQSSTK